MSWDADFAGLAPSKSVSLIAHPPVAGHGNASLLVRLLKVAFRRPSSGSLIQNDQGRGKRNSHEANERKPADHGAGQVRHGDSPALLATAALQGGRIGAGTGLALQLHFLRGSESMGNHDSKIVDAGSVD